MIRERFLSVLALVTAFSLPTMAQVMMSYDAQVTKGTYKEIAGGTILPLGDMTTRLDSVVFDGSATIHQEAFKAEGYPIGFDFKFDNTLMNQFVVGGHGYIVLGRDIVSATCQTNPYSLFNSDDDTDVVGVMYRSGVAAIPNMTEISYKTEGTAPERQLTVQFKNMQLWVDGWSGLEVRDTVSWQICLHESGEITMSFNGFEPSASIADNMNYFDGFKIGIRGAGEDRLLKANSFESDEFDTGDNILLWRASSFPADGTSYSFLPPEECEAPIEQASNLSLSPTSLSISGSFKPTSAADHYLVLLNESEQVATQPTDGTFYSKGDSIGDAIVLAYTEDSSFTSGDILSEASKYYVHVLAANSYCFYAPKYNTTNPLTLAVTTRPAAPAAVTVVAADTTKITLSVKADKNGDDVLLAYTTEPAMNDYAQVLPGGSFGQPTDEPYSVGDKIEGGGIVAYTGKASDAIEVTNLLSGKVYHFSAWSRNAAGLMSSTSTALSTTTVGTLPWTPDFSGENEDSSPIGWNHEGDWEVTTDRSTNETSVTLYMSDGDGVNGVEKWIETPEVYLSGEQNRLVMDVLMTEFLNRAWKAYSWRDKDTISVQVTTNGKEYKTIASYTKDNPLTFASSTESTKLYIPFFDGAGEKARLRLWGHIYGSPRIKLSNIRIEKKASCDYPINVCVPDSSIVGGDAVVYWTAQGEEDAWDVRYKLSSSDEWGDPVTVRTKSATITGLEGVTSYDVEVRAHCSDKEQSTWSEACTFTSGYAVPFNLAFADMSSLPDTWGIKQGVLASPTVLTDGGDWLFRKSWRSAYLYYTASSEAADDWLVTPIIDLGTDNVNSLVDIAVTTYTAAVASDAELKLVVAADGEHFNEKDTVLTIKAAEMPEEYASATYTASLKDYKGKVRLGLYVHSTGGTATEMVLDSLNFRYSCVNDIEAQVDTIGNDTVHVSWKSGADEWLVFCREAGSKAKPYQHLATPAFGVGQLKEFTAYEIGITKTCEPGDTAKVQLIKFTTTGTLCAAPTALDFTPDKYTALITWQGEAAAYNIRYRKAADKAEAWTVKQVTEPKIQLTDLQDGTEYAFAVQSQCGIEEADTSAYTDTYYFTTLAETCFRPENIAVTPTHNKATVHWEGTADSYSLAYRKATDEEWTETVIPNEDYTINGLIPETEYRLRMRSICAEGDSSLWTSTISFTTEAEPECVTPSELTVSEITDRSAMLSWTADESNISWNLRYRESTVSAWTEQLELLATSYLLENLKDNTAYIWRVQATCDEERTSNWAAQSKFSTTENSINDTSGISDIRVFAENGILNIVNPLSETIKSVRVYDANGRAIVSDWPNTTDNIFVRLSTHGQIIVKIEGTKGTRIFKIMTK